MIRVRPEVPTLDVTHVPENQRFTLKAVEIATVYDEDDDGNEKSYDYQIVLPPGVEVLLKDIAYGKQLVDGTDDKGGEWALTIMDSYGQDGTCALSFIRVEVDGGMTYLGKYNIPYDCGEKFMQFYCDLLTLFMHNSDLIYAKFREKEFDYNVLNQKLGMVIYNILAKYDFYVKE